MSSLEIRILNSSDVETHVRLRSDFVRDMFLGGEGLDWTGLEETARQWMVSHLQDGTYLSYAAFLDGSVVSSAGVLLYTLPPLPQRPNRTVGHILNFYTYPKFRRRGYGTALLEYLKTDAPKRGITRLFLNAAPMGEPLYRKAGFVEQAETALVLAL